ncbi:type II secretion system F family protein [Actinokineospora iranica]|uniref:type II secretion system F family protein n=1 Tax=Actinokineospora iranica TaxID=1271860 RepID=UPI001E286149|nr:type II secretion system F family protein [Actinokineospora iranica]
MGSAVLTIPLLLTALALVIGFPHPRGPTRLANMADVVPVRRRRVSRAPVLIALAVAALAGILAGVVAGVIAGGGAWWAAAKGLRPRRPALDHLGLAATWDLLAACLQSGMPVPDAIRAVAGDLPDRAGAALRDTADLLALGSDPVQAWSAALECPETAGLARGARRTARSGAALAGVARSLAAGVRERAEDAAEVRAQRAAVVIAGPLGLCFLPAFLCLGVLPVVIGMAARMSTQF